VCMKPSAMVPSSIAVPVLLPPGNTIETRFRRRPFPGTWGDPLRKGEGRMPEIGTPRELFLHELGDILYVERKLVAEALPRLIGEVQDDEFREALERHLDETRGHVSNVEQIFE